MLRPLFYLSCLLLLFSCHRAEVCYEAIQAPYMQVESNWADSVLLTMSLDEKIGQLLVFESNKPGELCRDSLYHWSERGLMGGVLLSGYKVEDYLLLIESLQDKSSIGLFNGTRELAALNNQFTDTENFPLPATLSAISSDSIHRRLLQLYVKQIKSLGVNFCFAPALSILDSTATAYDFNSYEHHAEKLLYRSAATLHEIQKAGVLAIGNAFKDLHYVEPAVSVMRDSILQKYKNLTVNGLSGLLTDESIYQIDTSRFYPANFLKRYLQKNIAFGGLIFAEVTAGKSIHDWWYAGTDIFLIKESPVKYVHQVKKAIGRTEISMESLDQKVHKVLMAKSWLGIHQEKPQVDILYAVDLMTSSDYEYYVHRLYESALLLANNSAGLIPFKNIDRHYFKIVEINEQPFETFKNYFSKYASFNSYNYPFRRDSFELAPLSTRHLKTSTVIVLLDEIDLDARRDQKFIQSINELYGFSHVVLVNFGNPINLKHFDKAISSVQLFERNNTTESLAAQLLFGGVASKGRLPIAVATHLPYNKSYAGAVTRLKYTLPQEVGIDARSLDGIDAIVQRAIRKKAMPGCQVMVVKDGKVFYDKNFGYHTYQKQQPVQSYDLYDLASVSKVAGTTLMSMKLYEDGKFKLDKGIGNYLAGIKKSRMRKVTVRDLLTHRSGLQSYMPIASYLNNRDAVVDGCNKYFCRERKEPYTIPIGEGMFFNKNWVPVIEKEVLEIRVKRRGRYLYSDVNFNLLKQMNERLANKSMDVYLDRHLFRPLNLRALGYNPLKRFSKSSIVPSAKDRRWRMQTLRGYVHDESAALLGGVAGNAGLFSNANDLAILCQFFLNKGSYGGKELLSSQTVEDFTRSRYGRRRALGFEIKTKRGTGSCSPYASAKTYGHKGFTGACIWVDPESQLTFIFLTNRIYPNPKNNKLTRYKVRQNIHNVIYKSLDTYRETLQPAYEVPVAVASTE